MSTDTPDQPLRDDDMTTDPAQNDGMADATPSWSEQDADGVDMGADADTEDHGGGHDTDSSDSDSSDSGSNDSDATDSDSTDSDSSDSV